MDNFWIFMKRNASSYNWFNHSLGICRQFSPQTNKIPTRSSDDSTKAMKKEKSAPINFKFVSHSRREKYFSGMASTTTNIECCFLISAVLLLLRCFILICFLFEVIFLLICWRYCEIRINLSVCQSGWDEGYLNFGMLSDTVEDFKCKILILVVWEIVMDPFLKH